MNSERTRNRPGETISSGPVRPAVRGRAVGDRQGTASDITITHSCGHEATLSVYGDPTRSRYAVAMADRPCRDCYRRVAVAKDTEAIKAGRRSVLVGSEKQMPWAQAIRQQRAEAFGDYVKAVRDAGSAGIAKRVLTREAVDTTINEVKQAIADLFAGTVEFDPDEYGMHSGYTRWWIDQRETEVRDIMAALLPDRDVLGGDIDGLGIGSDPVAGVYRFVPVSASDDGDAGYDTQREADLLDLDDSPF